MSQPLRIAVASGKGGTGKTTLATNLAVLLAETGARVAFLDCDVEEPNGHIFLAPTLATQTAVTLPVPVVDPARCTLCGACGDACRFSAILPLPTQVLTFPRFATVAAAVRLPVPPAPSRRRRGRSVSSRRGSPAGWRFSRDGSMSVRRCRRR